VDAGTHGKISDQEGREQVRGSASTVAADIFARLSAEPGACHAWPRAHIGSQLSGLAPLEAAFTKIGGLMREIRAAGHAITHMDLGGGVGVPYKAGDVFPSRKSMPR
jgi:diaminopimelate decarboxylase